LERGREGERERGREGERERGREGEREREREIGRERGREGEIVCKHILSIVFLCCKHSDQKTGFGLFKISVENKIYSCYLIYV
jgi:hypothetical protein